MKSVMRYVSKLSKTLWDGQQLVSGIGCQPETAFDEFLSTKLLHRKDGGVMFYHMVQSFPKCADIDPCAAHEAARRLAGYFEGCEVLVCTHVDREHIHSHCIINSVNFETGPHGVGAVLGHYVVGVHHVAAGLGHFFEIGRASCRERV